MNDRAVLPDMRAVTAFVEIIRSGSLTFTAEQLAIPKSTLSRRISQLEQRVGQHYFDGNPIDLSQLRQARYLPSIVSNLSILPSKVS